MNRPTLLGIDGGGTTTTAWLADAEGRLLGQGRAGPSNAKAVGTTAARDALQAAIAQAFAAAGQGPEPVEVACLGLAGFDRPEDRRLLEEWSETLQWARRLVLVNDGDLVLAAGTPDGVGVAVIAGTGSIAVGRGRDGRGARAGGWGHLFGDEGSAYAVALEGLRLAAKRADGRDALRVLRTASRPEPIGFDPLTQRLCEALGIDRPARFVTTLYSGDYDRARIAALAPVVVAAADDDPGVASWVLEPAGFELGQAVRAVAVALEWSEPTLPLAMAGGFLLAAEPVRQAMLGYLKRFTAFDLAPAPVAEPAAGAVLLARKNMIK